MINKIISIFLIFLISCGTIKPKYQPRVGKEDLVVNFNTFSDKPKAIALYKIKCDIIPKDGVFYTTEEHDKLLKTLKKCKEYDEYVSLILKKYSDAIDSHNKTIKKYNKLVEVYYEEKRKKKTWMYISIGSGLVISSFILILFLNNK